jgi:hypothetical protein
MKVKDGYVEAKAMIERGEIKQAEELLIRVAPHTNQFREWSGMYINLLVEQVLMPQKRYEEAIIWLYDSIDADLGLESWVSLLNLAIIKLRTANQWEGIAVDKFDTPRFIFEMVAYSETGPSETAKQYLEAINQGKAKKHIEKIPYPRASGVYEYLGSALNSKRLPTKVHQSFSDSRAITIYGLVQDGLQTLNLPANGSNQDALALVFFDYLEEDGPDFEEAKLAVLAGNPTVAALRAIRREAINRSAEAAFVMSEHLRRVSENNDYEAWLNVAIARGFTDIENEE